MDYRCLVRDSLFCKKLDWEYEKEWRYIHKSQDNYLSFLPEELLGIIVGYKMNSEVLAMMQELCSERDIPLVKVQAYPGRSRFDFMPIHFETMGHSIAMQKERIYNVDAYGEKLVKFLQLINGDEQNVRA